MGVYSPDLPQNGLGYGGFTFPDVVKWNCVFRENSVKPGTYSYRCPLVVGSVAEVQDTLRHLHQNRQDLQKPPMNADTRR